MRLSEPGEARVRGYLFILGRSLKSFLPREVAREALREVESHILERVDEIEASPNELGAVEKVLAELGPPLRIAQAYAAELAVDEALATGGLRAVLDAVAHLATNTVAGFGAFVVLLMGYAFGAALMVVAFMKPLFPENVGIIEVGGQFRSIGALFPVPPGAEVVGGYWVIPLGIFLGLTVIVATHRLARFFLGWFRSRRAPWKLARRGPS